MKFEGQKVLRPTPYHPERFKSNDKILVEIVMETKNIETHLYYITTTAPLSIDRDDNLIFRDIRAGIKFSEKKKGVTINIYDSYSIERNSIDYNVEGYNALEKCTIYANRKAMPAIKLHRKAMSENWMGYDYHSIIRK